MAGRILGETGSKRRRRFRFLVLPTLLASAAALFLAGGALAVHDQQFQLDGDASASTGTAIGGHAQPFDWDSFFNAAGQPSPALPDASRPGFTNSAFVRDFQTNQDGSFNTSDGTTFTTGSKDTLNITPGWQCTFSNNVNSKTDLMNVYAVSYTDPGTGHQFIYFALERNTNTGDGNVAFWFLQDKADCVSAGGTASWTGNHTDGDILVVSAFTNGGTVSAIDAYRWNGGAGGSLDTTPIAHGVDCRNPATGTGDTTCATVNTATITTPWLTANFKDGVGNSLRTAEFFEGGLDLTSVNLNDRCFSTFIGDTRSSQSLTATIFDYARGAFEHCGANISITPDAVNEVGHNHTFTVHVTQTVSGVTTPVQGVKPTVTLTTSNGAAVGNLVDTCASTGTDASGDCTVTFTSNVPGVVTGHASVTVAINGAQFPIETDGQGGNSGDAVKRFVDANIQISPNGVNRVGATHTFTAHVNTNDGLGGGYVSAANALVSFTIDSGPGTLSNGNISSTTCSTNANGNCTIDLTSAVTGVTTVSAHTTVVVGGVSLTRHTNDSGANSGPATKRWVNAKISIAPNATNEVGQPHTFTVTLQKDVGDGASFVPAAGEHVDFTLTDSNGANSVLDAAASTCDDAGANTDASGQCVIVFTSNSAGKVTGHASSTLSVAGSAAFTVETDGVAPSSGNAIKTFVDANIQITPNGVNRVGETHTFTAHVNINAGDGNGFVNAPDGTSISFTIDSGPGGFTSANPCTISGGTGSCQVDLSSAVTGVTTVSAHTTVSVGGVSLARSTDGSGANSGPATKRWVDAKISIAPNATNEVGQPHTFTVTLQKDAGTGSFVAAAGEHVDFTLTDSNGANSVLDAASSTCDDAGANTDASGQCTIVFTSNSAGKVTGHATSTLSVAGSAAFTVETDGVAPNSGNAVKTFVDAFITITPTATNGITESHTFTVHIEADDGSGGGLKPVSGLKPTVTLTPAGGASVSGVTDNCASTGTNASGDCTVTFTSNDAGTVTGHASITFSVAGHSLTIASDGTGANSGDAVKTFVDGSLSWLKKDGSGNLLGGATFEVCATGGTAASAGHTPLCVTILDNDSHDADPVSGQFLLNAYQSFGGAPLGGLALGTYTIQETIPPAGYTGDPFVETTTLTLASPDGVATHVWVNTKPGQGCTPGFWKNHPAAWNDNGDAVVIALKAAITAAAARPGLPAYAYNPAIPGMTNQLFGTIFALSGFELQGLSSSLTLLGALNTGGGGFAALARHGTAALLSSVSVQYPYTAAQVLDGVHNAFVAGNSNQVSATFPDGVLTDLTAANNLDESACPTG